MSKMFTVLLALIVAAAGSVAGYVYYTGESLTPSLPCARTTAAESEESEGCPLCSLAKKKSCCSGESSVKFQAMNATKASTTDASCCGLGVESILNVTASVIGGSAFSATVAAAVPSCCETESKTETALSGLVGVAAFGMK